MRILYITSYYKPAHVYGGPVVSNATICERLRRMGAEVVVLTTNAGGASALDVPLNKPVLVDGVEVWYFPLWHRGLGNFYATGLSQKISELALQFDIVHTDAVWSFSGFPIHQACKSVGRPYVVKLHGQLEPWSLSQKKLKKWVYLQAWGRKFLNHSNGILCTSQEEKANVLQLGFKSQPFVVPLGIDSDVFQHLSTGDTFRNQYQIPLEAPIILFLGRIHHKKRPDVAIESFGRLPKQLDHCHLVIAGPDEEGLRLSLEALASQYRCLDRVHFTGLLDRSQVLQALSASSLFIMPSEPHSENFGVSALEALAAGLPILVSEGVPIGYDAQNAGAGKVLSLEVDAFSREIARLISNPQQIFEMGRMGKELVQREFDIQIVTAQLLRQFHSIIETGHPMADSVNLNESI